MSGSTYLHDRFPTIILLQNKVQEGQDPYNHQYDKYLQNNI